MIDKETENIMVLQKYLGTNPTVQHLSRALTVFHADVLYEDDLMEPVHIPDAEVRFQHSYNNDHTIPAIRPPYYNSFWFSRQDFKFENGSLYVSGVRHDR